MFDLVVRGCLAVGSGVISGLGSGTFIRPV